MALDHSFDITSKANLSEIDNAVSMAMKEIVNRFDFKGSKSDITREAETLKIVSDDDYKLGQVIDVLKGKLVKRGISLKFLDPQKVEDSLGGLKKQDIKIKNGITQEQAKEINKIIKESKIKVQTQIQGDQIRVSSAKIDFLQEVITLLRSKNFPIELQFANYR
ncbi:YajQ family cyclic di-GMP-binding protein [candidate division WOR-1 bacterium RIFOXYA12_FULL_43_27]|uniref:Nucleotide-binding protein A2438_04905 n=1 Tax=candidate division WOR-1 bacterium RIFOXYC2_FULL_46_14 TaxID=1802587 RepID=A0A1F4U4U4_UNCSA|nr:MAG: YajQ family cyclic di-GMP-binding protein [candidate division WOR-1 bacterium RIFOXYA12_FULL_43_27]OGC20829.1 MAG: YajQ family cyclic di-GMP-binding protein [candidate division WOR-1 bacterium RIFOXYB2_FULL_46_45]OGC31434.1 MAG: YajQ family cyclic di-GMP-binding protein [candidate division WOR-1 bacterium RIFOXYA2_FULL_46_56]OGC39840.1 MAG: YajQ family cyclic di-GMP-binding protein [candidate division WOR-1 bacterium RIFOXYC2_FULL_46_14]